MVGLVTRTDPPQAVTVFGAWRPSPGGDLARACRELRPVARRRDGRGCGSPIELRRTDQTTPRGISGRYSRTTDEIIQWAAAKWGLHGNVTGHYSSGDLWGGDLIFR